MNFKERLSTGKAYISKNATVILLLLVLAIASYFLIKDAVGRVEEKAAIIRRDSTISITQVTQPTIRSEKYIPYEVKDTVFIKEVKVPERYIPSDDINQLKVQVKQLGQELFKTRKYRDSIKLKDTAGLTVGTVNIEDDISENTIKGRKTDYTLQFPTKTITITNTVQEPKRTQVFTGLEASYIQPLVPQLGVGMIIKNKKDNILRIGVGGQISKGVQPYGSIGYYKKLSFRK
jgi:hypothetical protein